MLRIFRNLRKNTLAEGHFKKYLFYAIGEIALIVVGILIALAIDNGNENALTREKEQVYLAGLKTEFEISQQKLKNLIDVNAGLYEGGLELMGYIDDPSTLASEKVFSGLLFHTFAYGIAFNPNNSLLVEMINSGSLKDVSNPKLRAHLVDWNSRLGNITRQEADLQVQRNRVVDLLRREAVSIRTVTDQGGVSANVLALSPKTTHASNLHLLDNQEFENNLLIFLLSTKSIEQEHYLPLLEELNLILTLIKAEIQT